MKWTDYLTKEDWIVLENFFMATVEKVLIKNGLVQKDTQGNTVMTILRSSPPEAISQHIRCTSISPRGTQCGFEQGHEKKDHDPDNPNHPKHGWATRGNEFQVPPWD